LGAQGKGRRVVKQILNKMKEEQSGGGSRGDSPAEANENAATIGHIGEAF